MISEDRHVLAALQLECEELSFSSLLDVIDVIGTMTKMILVVLLAYLHFREISSIHNAYSTEDLARRW